MKLLMSSQFRWLRGSVIPNDGLSALLVGFDACLMILCGADVLTDRWFSLVIRLLASMARFTLTVVMLPCSPVGFAGSLMLSRALLGLGCFYKVCPNSFGLLSMYAKHSVHIGYDIQYMLNSELILHVKQLVRSQLCVVASPLGT
jgi:hypothetical protein